MIVTFCSNYTLFVSRSIGFIEDIFYLFYLIFSFLFSYFTFDILSKISFNEHPADYKYLFLKKGILIFMSIQLVSYILNLILISFYNPIIFTEKILLSSLIFGININSVMFIIMQYTFIFTLKYDLYYVNLNLEVRPDLEYFEDVDEPWNQKSLSL